MSVAAHAQAEHPPIFEDDAAPAGLVFTFAGGKAGRQRLAQPANARPGPWVLYARFYVLNYQGEFKDHKFELADSRIGFGRTGPAIAGRIYIGIRKRF